MELTGTIPTFRDLFPKFGNVGEKQIIKIIKRLHLRDCLFILSKLSRHYYKYCLMRHDVHNKYQTYRSRCFELIDDETIRAIKERESLNKKEYTVIFPELSILHLIKMCLRYCDGPGYTKTENFPVSVLNNIGRCLLITNSVMEDWQRKGVPSKSYASEELLVNFTKQLIADKNYDVLQKLYQNYFLFNFLKKYKKEFDIEKIFIDKYKINVSEYFAFLFLLYSKFLITNASEEDWEMPHFNLKQALSNLKSKFKNNLLEDLIINKINYQKLDESFFNITDIIKRPLVELDDGAVVPISLKCLFVGLTDSVYFDILDYLTDAKEKSKFSEYFGKAIEDYFRDIILAIDKKTTFLTYGKKQNQANDAILVQKGGVIFFECKKRQFHNLEFLRSGNKELFFNRINEFYFKPLKQICDRIKDFRNGKFSLDGVDKNVLIYPVIICPLAPPIFSGAWDKFNLNQYVLPDSYKLDKNITHPEFMDFAELECIEEYLRENPKKSFIDLIKTKRGDEKFHNANWMVILHKNNMDLQNKRLGQEYLEEAENFKNLLF